MPQAPTFYRAMHSYA